MPLPPEGENTVIPTIKVFIYIYIRIYLNIWIFIIQFVNSHILIT